MDPTKGEEMTDKPMFELTIDGITEAIDVLRGTRPNRPRTASVSEQSNPYF